MSGIYSPDAAGSGAMRGTSGYPSLSHKLRISAFKASATGESVVSARLRAMGRGIPAIRQEGPARKQSTHCRRCTRRGKRGDEVSRNLVFEGRCWKFGDNIPTDVMTPAHIMFKTPKEMATSVLETVNPQFPKQVQPGDILVAGRNFGCSSGRALAAKALEATGVGAVVAELFARTFYRNGRTADHSQPVGADADGCLPSPGCKHQAGGGSDWHAHRPGFPGLMRQRQI